MWAVCADVCGCQAHCVLSAPSVLFLESTVSRGQRWCLWSQFLPVFLLCGKRCRFITEFQKNIFGLVTLKRLPAEPWRLWCHFLYIHLSNWSQAVVEHRCVTVSEENEEFQKETTSAGRQTTVVLWKKRELGKEELTWRLLIDFCWTGQTQNGVGQKQLSVSTFLPAFGDRSSHWW